MATFLWNTGTGNDGLIASTLSAMTTELNALASGSYATSSSIYSTANTGAAVWGEAALLLNGTLTPASTSNLAIPAWFMKSLDGSTFETASVLLARPANFTFGFTSNSYATQTVFAPGPILLPNTKFKVAVLNNIGVSLPATGNILRLGFAGIVTV